MNARRPFRLTLAVFDRFIADNEPLKGDLIEEFKSGRSQWWLLWQVIGALVCRLTLRPRQGVDVLVVGAALLVLVSFEAVFVTGLMHRLLFGPPLPNITGYFYLLQKGRLDAPVNDVMRPAVASLYAPLVAIAASMPIGWLIARFHQHHHALSIAGFALSVMLCAALNLQLPFAIQFLTMVVFIVGVLGGACLTVATGPESIGTPRVG